MSASTKHFIVATAGHVDHGKSGLVRALSGTDPDRLPEEKARGITIDLGFAHLDLRSGSDRFLVGLIDVPGHEDFVKNMVAGVGAVDLALLVVAADDGWMPQTEEHLQILTWLGVRSAVVALTKADLPAARLSEVEEQVRGALSQTPFADAPIIKTSIVTGQGLDELRATLTSLLAAQPLPADLGKPRLPVDRVFTLHGVGTVVTGTLSGGRFERGQNAIIQPGRMDARLRSIQCYSADVTESGPGRRTALNLVDQPGASMVKRGDVITLDGCGEPTWVLDVLIMRPSRATVQIISETKELRDGVRLRIHHGSANVPARIFFLDPPDWQSDKPKLAELRLEGPLLALGKDRFILRNWGEQRTLAGGLVLDARARPRRFRTVEQRRLLAHRADALNNIAAWVESELERDHMVPVGDLLKQTGYSHEAIAKAAEQLIAQGKLSRTGNWIVATSWWDPLQQQVAGLVDAFHREHPQAVGIQLNDLHKALDGLLPSKEILDLLIDALAPRGYVRSRTVVRHQAHQPALPAVLQKEGARITAAIVAKPLEPPARKELAPTQPAVEALRFLLERGELVSLNDEVVLLAETYAALEAKIVAHLQKAGRATVSELRQQVGTTRRILVPLLEQMDRSGVTLRQGDVRVLRAGLSARKLA